MPRAFRARFAARAEAKTFYWISHGSPADPVWTYFLAGAEQWAKDTGQTVKTSFHNGDVASQQEAIRSAIAAKADAIVTTSPDPGSLVDVVKEARAAGIPVINFNTPDPKVNFNAYVGGDLVDRRQGLGAISRRPQACEVRRLRLDAGRGSRRELRRRGGEGRSRRVFKPLNITWEVTDATLDQANVISRMSDYLTANRKKVKAIIGLGDMVTGSIKRVFDQVGVKPAKFRSSAGAIRATRPQEVMDGYVNAAEWQDPQATSYLALSLANMATERHSAGLQHHRRRALRARTPRRFTTRSCRASKLRASLSPRARRQGAAAGGLRQRRRAARGTRVEIALTRRRPTARVRRLQLTFAASAVCGNRSCAARLSRAGVRPARAARARTRGLRAINPDFLSVLNITNTLTFTVELGLIALAMTLLMTAGEFDLSVGSLFGFAPVMMWTLYNSGADARWASPSSSASSVAALIGLVNGLFVTRLEDPLVPRHARHAAGRARHGAVRHRRLSAAHLERRRRNGSPSVWSAISISVRSASTPRSSGSSPPRSCSATC